MDTKFLDLIQYRDIVECSSTFLVGTTPQKNESPKLSATFHTYDNEKTVNITVTYNQSFTDMDTLWEGPKLFQQLLKQGNKLSGNNDRNYIGWKSYYFINEKHANDKRWHMHGQVRLSYSQRTCGIKQFQNLFRTASKLGRCSVKWNNPLYEVKQEEYPSYTHYCFKHSEDFVISSDLGNELI